MQCQPYIYAAALDSSDAQHVFIATPSGVFGSTNGGNTWSLLNSQDFNANGAAFIVRRVINSPQFLAAPATTTDSQSTATGTDISAALTIPGALVSFSQLRLYLTTQSGLVVSRDGGVTWLPPVLASGDIVESLEQDRSNADHLLASVVSSYPN